MKKLQKSFDTIEKKQYENITWNYILDYNCTLNSTCNEKLMKVCNNSLNHGVDYFRQS